MSIELERETLERLTSSIRRYFEESLEMDIGDLKASLLLKFILQEIAPSVYNQAVSDVARHVRDLSDELEGVIFEPEFGFWKSAPR